MAAIANLSINDATPTATVFTPRKANPEGSQWTKVGYTPANTFSSADSHAKLGVSPASAKRPTIRVNAEMSFPNPAYVAGSVDDISVARFYGSWVIPEDFSQANRAHFEALCKNYVANAVVTAAVVSVEGPF